MAFEIGGIWQVKRYFAEADLAMEIILEIVFVVFDLVLDSIFNPVFDKLGKLLTKFKKESRES